MKTKLIGVYKNVVFCMMWLMLCSLAFLCSVSTAVMTIDMTEKTFFLKDSPLMHIAFCVGAFVLFLLLEKSRIANRISAEESLFRRVRFVLLAMIFVLSALWVLYMQPTPRADQMTVQMTVEEHRRGDQSTFAYEGYLGKHHHQIPYTLLCYLLSFPLGCGNFTALGLINAAGLTLFYAEMTKACDLLGFRRDVQIHTLVMAILFYPPILYCSFIYGSTLGLAFSMLAIRLEIQFFQKEKARYAVGSSLAIMLGVMFKQNYLIFFVGMLVYAVIKLLQNVSFKRLLLPALAVVMMLVQAKLPLEIARMSSGEPLDQGVSSLSYAAMGLQESTRAPGWYNGYNVLSYEEIDCNGALHTQIAQKEIISLLKNFVHDPLYAFRHFTKKTLSQWGNPTFQGYWVNQVQHTAFDKEDWVASFLSVQSMYAASKYLDAILVMLFIGTLLYLALCRKQPYYLDSLVFPTIFIGGFLFHFVWEAKGQYTLPYIMLLIPFAMAGYAQAASKVLGLKACPKKPSRSFVRITCFTLVIALVLFVGSKVGLRYITNGDEDYRAYMVSLTEKGDLP